MEFRDYLMQSLGGILNFDLFSSNMPRSGIALRGERRNAVQKSSELMGLK